MAFHSVWGSILAILIFFGALIVIVCTIPIGYFLIKRGVGTRAIALPSGISFIVVSLLAMKVTYDRGQGSFLFYAFLVVLPFLGYSGTTSQLDDIRMRVTEREERKRTGKKRKVSNVEKVLNIVMALVILISTLVGIICSVRWGVTMGACSLFLVMTVLLLKPRLFVNPKKEWDDESVANVSRTIRVVGLGGIVMSIFLLYLAWYDS